MCRVFICILAMLWCIPSTGFAEAEINSGVVRGTVVAAHRMVALEYVTVAIYHSADHTLLGGTVTKADGKFKLEGLPPGVYYLDISFIGYSTKRINDVVIERKNQQIDIGLITLGENSENLEEVEVVAERAAIEFQLDKKVVNVSKHYTSISGSAVNVLENVPSIVVDIEGNVSLRGSTSFSVLVNGVPSILEPSEALQQIPASTIENIEIITNPSAKYNPDGTSGIINIITKKNSSSGLSGVYNLKAGTNNAAGDFLFNLKRKKMTYFISGDYYLGEYSGEKNGYRNTFSGDSVFSIEHDGDIRNKFDRYNIKGGLEFRIDTLKTMNIDVGYGGRNKWDYADLDYSEYNNYHLTPTPYISDEDVYRGNEGISVNAFYTHQFDTKGHEMRATFTYRQRESDEYSKNVLRDIDGTITEGKKSTEEGPMGRLETKLDYTRPTGKHGKIEAGYQSTFNNSDDETGQSDILAGSGLWVDNPLYDNHVEFRQNIHALYFIYGNQTSKFGYQIGLRGEYTNRTVEALRTGSNTLVGDIKATIDRYDYFPSAHLSYKLPANQELMASYSRRIERAQSYHFEPFYTWVDAYNIRHGNSSLLPEYIDSYELNYLKKMENSYFSLETYYSMTHNKVEWVRSIYEDNIIQRFPENVGKDYYLGVDASYSFDVVKWWRMDLSGSLYNYRVKGQWEDYSFDEDRLTWNYRVNQTVKLNSLTQLQGNWRYYSKRITSQGIYQPVYTFDIAVRKEFMKRKLTGIVELRDVFSSNNRENTNDGIGFKDHYFQKIHTPVLTFVLTYRFNNYKPDKRKGTVDDSLGGDESME
ncbi:TonB-dependent receptor domain-containing protein [Saccharicrinis sp. 156]|uniref:TonB-dependent receptor domain-containing protein n=1 Tax=Saccharicrinis sp. 156 TaxID=3417574 RepID=UPI003D330740